MKVPIFLLADNSDFPDKLFVVHTDYPRFVMDVETEEVDWWDKLEKDEDSDQEIENLMQQALNFVEIEMQSYDEDDENENSF